jgi:hypothetical protein
MEPPFARREVSEEDYKKFTKNWTAFMKKSSAPRKSAAYMPRSLWRRC